MNKQRALFDDELIQADHVRVRHTGEASELVQSVDAGGRGVAQGFERHDLAAGEILNFVDHSHSARTDTSEHREALRAGKIIVRPHR